MPTAAAKILPELPSDNVVSLTVVASKPFQEWEIQHQCMITKGIHMPTELQKQQQQYDCF